ncbi:cilia- and flagella-associated protein 46 [Discoglossus pictus]
MDAIIRQHLCAAESQQDADALIKAYTLIKDANTKRTLDVSENFSSDLYVLCAEQALQLENPAVSQDCLEMYFKSTAPPNQFFGRAYLCKAQLHAPKSDNNVDELEKSVAFYLKAIDFAKKQQRYYFLVYNASLLYWQMARPFLKPGSRHILIPSLRMVVKALDEINDPDATWTADLMLELLECLLDAQKMKEAADFASLTAEYIKMNVPLKYPLLFSKMVQHKIIDSAKAAKEVKTSATLSVIYKMQKLSLKKDTLTAKDIFTKLNEIYKMLSMTTNEETTQPECIMERTSLLIELTRLSMELKCYQSAASCIQDLKSTNITEPDKLIIIECLECEYAVQSLGTKIATYTKSIVEAQLKNIRRLESTLQEAVRLGDPNIIQVVCTTQWNLCLPLLQHNLRKHVRKSLISISETMENVDSLLSPLRCQIHLEIAQAEEDDDRIEVALKHIQKALILDNNGPYHNFLKTYLHRLQLSVMLYKKPERLEDKAALIIEQAKQSSLKDSVRKKRSLLVNAGLSLAPDVFQMVLDSENEAKVSTGKNDKNDRITYLCMKAQHHSRCVQKTEGHLQRINDKNDTERVRLWADLAKVARKQEVWDVCRAACRFCLLYDDGRWKISKHEVLQKKESARSLPEEERSSVVEWESAKTKKIFFNDERTLLRTFAEIRFINAEATIHLLKSEGCKLNDRPIPPEDTSIRPMSYVAVNPEERPEWIVYKEWITQLSQYATDNFLKASELGVELEEAWITHNAAVYILNHNKHVIAAGRLSKLTDTFQILLSNLKKTGHNGNTVLLVMLSSSLAKGLIHRWIPVSAANKRAETSLHTEKGKKAPGKGSEKSNLTPVLSIDPNGLPELKLALEVCEYALDLTNGSKPEEVIPISVRQQVLSAWVKAKQLCQQQIGHSLGTGEEENNNGQNQMTRVLVALEMHSCNGLGLMDFTVPSLSQIFKMASECNWSDPLVELQTFTRLAHFAYNAHDHALVLSCTQKALEFAEMTSSKKWDVHSATLEQEMLSIAACVQGQSIIDNLSGEKHLRHSAIKAFQLSSSFASGAGNLTLTLQAAKHFWHACSPFIKAAEEREILKDATMSVIKAITDAESKVKQGQENDITYLLLWPNMDIQSQIKDEQGDKGLFLNSWLAFKISVLPSNLQAAGGMKKTVAYATEQLYTDVSENNHKLRTSLYELLFNMYADKNDWESGLKVLDEAVQILPRTKHRLGIFKHRVLVKARLGHNFFMDIQKFKDENEDYVSYIWHHVALTSKNTSEQLACYQKAIDALQKPENEWQKVEYLMELAEWLYCNQFPVSDAINLLDWAVDILLQMMFPISVEEDTGSKAKLKPRKKSSMLKDQKQEEDRTTEVQKSECEGNLKISSNPLEGLRNVGQLETLAQAHTLMAVIGGRSSPSHEQHCLMAYTYIMRIWQVSLPAAGSFIKTLANIRPSSQNPQSASSRKDKGKKEAKEPPVIKEKLKRKGSVDVLPSSTEEWATYDCPDEIREAFKLDTSCNAVNPATIVKPTYSLYYLDLLTKELQGISFTHLTLPVFHLAEVIAHDVVESKSLSDYYHLRISQICTDLKLYQAATYHEKSVGNVFISEQEQIRYHVSQLELRPHPQRSGFTLHYPYLQAAAEHCCRQEMFFNKEKKQDGNHSEQTTNHQQVNRKKILRLHPTEKGLSGLSLPYLWLDKADVLIQLGVFQPARHLLSEAYKCFQEIGDKHDILKCLYLLSVLSNSEKNHGQAKALLKEAQHIERDAEYCYKTTIAMTEAVLGEDYKHKEKMACKILENSITTLKMALPKQTNCESELGFLISSLHVRKLCLLTKTSQHLIKTGIASSQVIVMLLEICDKMSQIEDDLHHYGYEEYRAKVMMEHSNVLRILASIAEDEDRKHSYYIDACVISERAIGIQEQVLYNIQSLFSSKEAGAISLPAMRTLAKMKLRFTELSLEIIQLVTIEERKKLQEQKRKGQLRVAVEEFVRTTPDYNSVEQEWKTLGCTLGSTALSQLASVMAITMGCNDLKAKCLHLTGKCLYLLSVKVDPLSPDVYWNENFLDESTTFASKQAYDDLKWSTGDVPLTNKEQDKIMKRKMELKGKRKAAQIYLAQATEILLQSINTAITNNLVGTLSDACLQMCLCFGQFEPISTAMFLALYQSCTASMMIKDVVCAATQNTSNSQFAALLHHLQLLQKKGNNMSDLQKSIEQRLCSTSKVWENLKINMQHFNIINDLPPNFNIIILQHSEDGGFLHCAFFGNAKASGAQKGKLSQPQKTLRAKVARCSVDPQMFLNLLGRMELFKQDMMQILLKRDQQSCNRRNHLFENIQDTNKNAGMNSSNYTEDETEKKMSSAFHEIVDAMEDYLNPVLQKLELSSLWQPSPELSAAESGTAKSKEKEEKAAASGAPGDIGECIILLADKSLMELPLEALSILNDDGISSVSRDFSLQLFYNRLHREENEDGEGKRDTKSAKGSKPKSGQKKNVKIVPINRTLPANCVSVDTQHFKYIVDPYNEERVPEEFSPGFKMSKMLEKYNQQFTPLWEGIIGDSHVPSLAEWENLIKSCSAFIFYGTERFLNNFLLDKFVALNLTECQMIILLDLVRTNRSFLRQSKVDVQKSETYLTLERPVETAILLSITGVRSIMLNQLHTTLEQNARRLDYLSENLLELGNTNGQTIHSQRKLGDEYMPLKVDADNLSAKDPQQEVPTLPCHPKLIPWSPSKFSYVLYGLPNMVVM